jgi:DNA polymerase III subunit epsilon
LIPETLLILDTETDGVDSSKNLVVEIGAVWWHVGLGCTLGCWSELVVRESNAAQDANGIPPEALRYGLPWDHAIEGLKSRVARADLLVAHNESFDRGFLPDLGKPWVCSMDHIPWPSAESGLALIKVAVAHGVAVTQAHRALSDCLLIAHTLSRVHEREGADGIRERLRLAMRPRSRCVAQVPYERRQLAKDAKFRWNGEMKSWWKDVVDEEITKLPFQVRRVPSGSPEYAGLAKG